jgi:hypothetical protein
MLECRNHVRSMSTEYMYYYTNIATFVATRSTLTEPHAHTLPYDDDQTLQLGKQEGGVEGATSRGYDAR